MPGGPFSEIAGMMKKGWGIQSQQEAYFLSEAGRQKWINEMIRGISTQTQSALLTEEESLAREGASEATRSSTRRGIQQRGMEAEQKGISALEQFAQMFNQRGQALLDKYTLGLKGIAAEKDIVRSQGISGAFSQLGQALALMALLP